MVAFSGFCNDVKRRWTFRELSSSFLLAFELFLVIWLNVSCNLDKPHDPSTSVNALFGLVWGESY